MILPTTCEDNLRERLLDVVYAQWQALGTLLSLRAAVELNEVIDPEALLWCSFEFLPTEPRLHEQVMRWIFFNRHLIVRQRLKHFARTTDPRYIFFRQLQPKAVLTRQSVDGQPVDEAAEVVAKAVREALEERARERARFGAWPPLSTSHPTTLLLQARELLGNDIRPFIIIYLLANPAGGRLRDIQRWTAYTYRNVAETVSRLEAAGVLTRQHGGCRLTQVEPWHALFPAAAAEPPVLVDWRAAFEACIGLLRGLAKARERGVSATGPVVETLRREAAASLTGARLGWTGARSTALGYLLEGVNRERTAA